MAGYPEIEDVPAHASEKWMNDVLRQEIGFKGVVESEGGGFGTLASMSTSFPPKRKRERWRLRPESI